MTHWNTSCTKWLKQHKPILSFNLFSIFCKSVILSSCRTIKLSDHRGLLPLEKKFLILVHITTPCVVLCTRINFFSLAGACPCGLTIDAHPFTVVSLDNTIPIFVLNLHGQDYSMDFDLLLRISNLFKDIILFFSPWRGKLWALAF